MTVKSLKHSSLTDNVFYRSMLAGNTAYSPSDEDVLAEEILTSSQASVTFSGLDTLAADYKHLQIRMVGQGSSAYNLMGIANGDTANNYNWHWLEANGSTVNSGGATNSTFMNLGVVVAEANVFSGLVIDILDFSNTSKYTTVRSFYGASTAGTKWMGIASAAWRSTNALTSLELKAGNAHQIGSSFTLIGVK